MKKLVNKIVSITLCATMLFSIGSVSAFAKTADETVHTIEIDLTDYLVSAAASTADLTLGKHMASKSGTGAVYSLSESFNLSTLPTGAKVVSVTAYYPTRVSTSQSTFTAITDFEITNVASNRAILIPFLVTDPNVLGRLDSRCTSTLLAGADAKTTWKIRIKGTILQNLSGFDGFTVWGGAKVIVTYT